MRRSSPILLLAVLALACLPFVGLAAGCGSSVTPSDACGEATDKLAKCGIHGTSTGSGMDPACAGALLCNANCTKAASCDALVDAFAPMPGAASQAYFACLSKCAGTP